MAIEYKTTDHLFGFGETIEAIIRACNDQNINKKVLALLVERFNVLNPDARPPKLGQVVKVPILLGFDEQNPRTK